MSSLQWQGLEADTDYTYVEHLPSWQAEIMK